MEDGWRPCAGRAQSCHPFTTSRFRGTEARRYQRREHSTAEVALYTAPLQSSRELLAILAIAPSYISNLRNCSMASLQSVGLFLLSREWFSLSNRPGGHTLGAMQFLVSRATAHERQPMKLRAQVPAPAVDEERVSHGDLVDPQEAERDYPAGCRGPGAARHFAHLTCPFRHLVAADRRDVGVHAQAEEFASHLSHVGPARHDLLADIAPFRETQGEIRRDLQGERVLPHLHAEPRRAGLDAQDLERVTPDGRHVPPRERVPEFAEARSGRPDRKAEFPEPPDPAYVALVRLVDREGHEGVLRKRTRICRQHTRDEIACGWPVHLDVPGRSEVVELDVVANPRLLHEPKNRVLLRRLDVEDERVRERVDAQVPEPPALLIQEEGIRRHPRCEDLQVGGDESVEERDPLGPREPALRAVAPIDHPGPPTDRAGLFLDRAVTGRDQPARLRAEDRTFEIVVRPQPEFLHRRSHDGIRSI